jgi:hypothetical protein
VRYLDLPIRVRISDGKRLPPSGIDPYSLPWVQGAASTLPRQTRAKYPGGFTDIREKLAVLSAKRPVDEGRRPRSPLTDHDDPDYGPRLRPLDFTVMQNNPLPSSGNPMHRGID